MVARVMVISSAVIFTCWLINRSYKRRGSWELLSSKDVALVTGGANGLGLDMVRLLLSRGMKVVVVDRETIQDKTLAQRVIYEQCDLRDGKAVLVMLNKVKAKHGYPTVLINNAAMRHSEPLKSLSYSRIHDIGKANVLAPLILMKETLKSKKRLYTVNIASILGIVSPANLSIYSATKASLISLHDSISHEHSCDMSKRFLLVTPGQLNTRMFRDVEPPKQWLAPILESHTLAQMIFEKCDAGERGVLHGPLYTYLIPMMTLLPYSVAEFCRWFSEMDVSVKKDED
jgi:short-subunit dehydrogenase